MLLSLYRKVPVSPQNMAVMAELLRENDIDPAPAFAAAGVTADQASNPLATVNGAAELAFQEKFVELTDGRRHVWLELGLRSRFLMLGLFGVAVMTSRTLRSAMETAGRLAWLHHSLALYDLRIENGVCTLRMRLDQTPPHLREFTALRDAPATTDLLNMIWGGRFPFLGIELTARDRIFTQVRKPDAMVVSVGEPGSTWTWPAELLDQKLPAADRRSHELSLRQADQLLQRALATNEDNDLAARISRLLQSGEPGLSLPDAATRLGMSARTLQRRLTEAGVSYRQLQAQERINGARRLLRETSLPVAEIAWRLGYTETSAFNHSFRRTCGMSPRAWRKSIGQASTA
ncbi:AraC family transcriptional regulator [Camelimonas fluminis]|uniref:Helix-turn-helix domain-containing protein n=1 Tax=Camelimonas fluminis TaxID=1576911 RepID=A0ABV7UDY7_9HYPH|nr:AraC family transcriptional regulator [Camelimonas fluminis]GHE52079.1 AraC family transcriptional regulator [Camelimonas fluminis]